MALLLAYMRINGVPVAPLGKLFGFGADVVADEYMMKQGTCRDNEESLNIKVRLIKIEDVEDGYVLAG